MPVKRTAPNTRASDRKPGDIRCFSFCPGKDLGAYGEARMVADKPEYARVIRAHDWGAGRIPPCPRGYNYRVEDSGAVLK
jgi:dTDP-4-amino-4,6-dideoxygalactose transaminase